MLTNTVVQAFGGSGELEFIGVEQADGRKSRLMIDNAVIRIGVDPNKEFVSPSIETDEGGYLRVDREGRTSARMIYAIGDVANPVSPTISSAVGMAATAAKSIARSIRTFE